MSNGSFLECGPARVIVILRLLSYGFHGSVRFVTAAFLFFSCLLLLCKYIFKFIDSK